jgi:hypothetical protein
LRGVVLPSHITSKADVGLRLLIPTLPLLFILILSILFTVNAIESVVLLYTILPILLLPLSQKDITHSLAIHVARANCTLSLLSIIAPSYVLIAVNTEVSQTTCNLLNGIVVHNPVRLEPVSCIHTVLDELPYSLIQFDKPSDWKYKELCHIPYSHEPAVLTN